MPERFHILVVCTGNICRSPLAQQLLVNALVDIPQVRVSSAGTQALVGHPMDEASQRMARQLGVDNPERHVAEQLVAELPDEPDLILALARHHRRFVVETNPRVSRRAFTIREFARLADAITDTDLRIEMGRGPLSVADRMRIAAASVVLARGEMEPLDDPCGNDVIDPYRRGPEVLEQSTQQIVPAVEATARLLRRACRLPL